MLVVIKLLSIPNIGMYTKILIGRVKKFGYTNKIDYFMLLDGRRG
jgi:hypothetical protein